MSFSLTRKTDYALVALTALAEFGEDGQRPTLSARQIAQRFDLPLALLMNVLKDLHKAGLVCSRRGAGGGYMLCHDPSEVSMLQIIEANEGPVRVALCCEDESAAQEEREHTHEQEPCVACRVLAKCPIQSPMQQFDDLVRAFLGSVTLQDLINGKQSPVALTHPGART